MVLACQESYYLGSVFVVVVVVVIVVVVVARIIWVGVLLL